MKEFSTFDPGTGLILYAGTCQAEVFATLDNTIEGQFDSSLYYVNNGVAVAYPKKPSEFHVWDLQTVSWVVSQEAISSAKTDKSKSLYARCKKEILSGFSSSALGVEHHYPSKETDQANLNASVTSSFYPNLPLNWTTPFWCERNGIWDYKMHSAEQIQQVGVDGKNIILAKLSKNAQLHQMVSSATTLDEIQSINW